MITPGDFSKQVGFVARLLNQSVNQKLSKIGSSKQNLIAATRASKKGAKKAGQLSFKGAKFFGKQVGKAIGFSLDVAFGGSDGGPAAPTQIVR